MSNYYSVTVRAMFGVLAESQEEAEEIAQGLMPLDDWPAGADPTVDAYLTPNQCDALKRRAINA